MEAGPAMPDPAREMKIVTLGLLLTLAGYFTAPLDTSAAACQPLLLEQRQHQWCGPGLRGGLPLGLWSPRGGQQRPQRARPEPSLLGHGSRVSASAAGSA